MLQLHNSFERHIMHIVYLTHQFFPRHIGGVEVYTLGLARHAISAGHQVTIITYHESESANSADFGSHHTSYEGLPVIEIHYNLSTADRPARYEYNNSFTAIILKTILKELRPDLAHVMHGMKLSASALQTCDTLQIPFVVSLADFWFICPRHTLMKWDGSLCNGPVHPLYCVRCVQDLHGFAKHPHILRDLPDLAGRNRFIKQSLLKAKRIIALSEFQKQMYVKNGIPSQRVEVIQHGLDQPPVKFEAHVPQKPYRIGYIGSLVEHKGVHILLSALARIPHVEVTCDIYGAMNTSPFVERICQLAEGDTRIRFMETFDSSEMPKVMRSFDILAVPSVWYENEPLVVKSALQAGVPVLCNDIGSLPNMVTHGKTGWLVAERTVAAWVTAIQDAIEQLPTLNMRPLQMKTIEENANEMLAIYTEICS
jgi:glycosyltransferase involved in cell wall biosynthesis